MDKYCNSPEEAIQMLTQSLKMSKIVPQNYCKECCYRSWPTKRCGSLQDISTSIFYQLKTYRGAQHFQIADIEDRGYGVEVKGGVCLTVFFTQHATRFFVCPSNEDYYACGPEDWIDVRQSEKNVEELHSEDLKEVSAVTSGREANLPESVIPQIEATHEDTREADTKPNYDLQREIISMCDRMVCLADTSGGDPWELLPKIKPLLEQLALSKSEQAKEVITKVMHARHCMLELHDFCAILLEKM